MLCREGKISLISFTISALTSISLSSLVLYLYSLELNNLSNSFYTFIGPIIFYVIHYIFGLIVLPKDESEVSENRLFFVIQTLIFSSIYCRLSSEQRCLVYFLVRQQQLSFLHRCDGNVSACILFSCQFFITRSI